MFMIVSSCKKIILKKLMKFDLSELKNLKLINLQGAWGEFLGAFELLSETSFSRFSWEKKIPGELLRTIPLLQIALTC